MILTAAAIQAARESGDIVIDPFDPGQLSPDASIPPGSPTPPAFPLSRTAAQLAELTSRVA